MSETSPETLDHRPKIVICAYEMGDTGWDPFEDLSGEPWRPAGARTVVIAADEPEALTGTLAAELGDERCRGLLLVGRTRTGDDFRVQVRAVNRSLDGTRRLDDVGPGVARATAPVAEIVRALNEAGQSAAISSEAEEDAGSYLLYRVLADLPEGLDCPAVGLLRAPADAPDAAVQRAVKTAVQAMANHLSALPRSRAS